MTETEWWQSLEGDELELNTAGSPPYDVERVAKLLVARLEGARHVLDFGCGTGRLAEAYLDLAPDGTTVYGRDVSTRATEAAQVRLDGRRFEVDPGPLWPRAWFDGAYSVAVLQHLPAWAVLVQAIGGVSWALKRGARFVFQYVEGTEDAFLSHQTNEDRVRRWCEFSDLGVEAVEVDEVYPQWRWVTAVRP